MGKEYLIDTNVAIYYFAQLLPANAVNLLDNIIPNISVVNRIELLSWPNAKPADLKMLHSFITDCIVFDLTEDIVLKTIEIRKTYKVKLGDAIIAATAITNNFILLTRNVKDFNKVPGLQVLDPYSL